MYLVCCVSSLHPVHASTHTKTMQRLYIRISWFLFQNTRLDLKEPTSQETFPQTLLCTFVYSIHVACYSVAPWLSVCYILPNLSFQKRILNINVVCITQSLLYVYVTHTYCSCILYAYMCTWIFDVGVTGLSAMYLRECRRTVQEYWLLSTKIKQICYRIIQVIYTLSPMGFRVDIIWEVCPCSPHRAEVQIGPLIAKLAVHGRQPLLIVIWHCHTLHVVLGINTHVHYHVTSYMYIMHHCVLIYWHIYVYICQNITHLA